MKKIIYSFALSLVMAFVSQVNAGTIYQGDCSTSDVTFGVLGVTPGDADDCFGPIANANTDVSYFNDEFGDGWGELIKLEIEGSHNSYSQTGEFQGISFVLSGNKGSDSDWKDGGWSLSWSGDSLPATIDFAIGLKAGYAFSGYLFDDVYLTEENSPGMGDWEISFEHCRTKSDGHTHTHTCGCKTNDLSHFSLYVKDMVSVPAPGALALMGLGLLGLVAARRRKV